MSLCVSAPTAAPAVGLASRLRRLFVAPGTDVFAVDPDRTESAPTHPRSETATIAAPRRRSALGETNVLLL
ncbi:hypothetical protein [Aureimonas jatrophae]|uniref:Uncharacterized protein n=1 Tax=Aureimonas jatrophae TaxID=1166073 RepID=A0A1H0HUT5_9HYPH|nr:hypothetical protein [Aureimonas jatrophae]MBB3950791.1 hypothetical protein [Aureimonas jatrophae]SDO22982.1 hypothetical protein SAMN05192530_104298 [Aureimonas jatrophae]